MTTTRPGRPSKLTAASTTAICDVIAAGGTRSIAARAACVHPDTLNGWLRRAAQEDTETTLEADDYTTLRELRALAKTAHVPGYGRLRKADLATAIAAKPSEYSVFSAALKKAEAEAQVEWLSEDSPHRPRRAPRDDRHRGVRRRREPQDPHHPHHH